VAKSSLFNKIRVCERFIVGKPSVNKLHFL